MLEQTARWFAAIWQRAGYVSGVHLRRIHYWTVSQSPAALMPNGKPYENTDACWKFLGQASKMARYAGLVSIADIADNKNPAPHVHAAYQFVETGYEIALPRLENPHIWIDGLTVANAQPYHLELWCEKSTMNDVLLPVCQRYGVNLVTFEGEVSITACNDLIKRIQASGGKPARVWYISDFDPAGNSMPVAMSRKVEYLLSLYGHDFDVRIKPLLLTAATVEQYRLPRIPIKETEKRADKFEAAFGTGAVELDALEALYPGVLATMVNTALSAYYSRAAADEIADQEQALRLAISAKINVITEKYQPEIEALNAMIDELKAVEVDASEYSVDTYAPHVEESDNWLFDSGRGYVDQISHYKDHKGIERGEA